MQKTVQLWTPNFAPSTASCMVSDIEHVLLASPRRCAHANMTLSTKPEVGLRYVASHQKKNGRHPQAV